MKRLLFAVAVALFVRRQRPCGQTRPRRAVPTAASRPGTVIVPGTPTVMTTTGTTSTRRSGLFGRLRNRMSGGELLHADQRRDCPHRQPTPTATVQPPASGHGVTGTRPGSRDADADDHRAGRDGRYRSAASSPRPVGPVRRSSSARHGITTTSMMHVTTMATRPDDRHRDPHGLDSARCSAPQDGIDLTTIRDAGGQIGSRRCYFL